MASLFPSFSNYVLLFILEFLGHSDTLSISNLNHFQFEYKFSSSSYDKVSAGNCSGFLASEAVGIFCLYFFAISSASEYTLCKNKTSRICVSLVYINQRGINDVITQ